MTWMTCKGGIFSSVDVESIYMASTVWIEEERKGKAASNFSFIIRKETERTFDLCKVMNKIARPGKISFCSTTTKGKQNNFQIMNVYVRRYRWKKRVVVYWIEQKSTGERRKVMTLVKNSNSHTIMQERIRWRPAKIHEIPFQML